MEEETGGTMSSSEGGREIQLAKERLASAKAMVESASKNFVAAKETKKQVAKTMENAKAHEEYASKQLAKAKGATKQATKAVETATRGVNTAHLELLSSQNEVKKAEESLKATEKRREVVTVDSDDDEEEGNSKKKMKVSTEEEAKGDSEENQDSNNQVVVIGCGSTDVNGVYRRKLSWKYWGSVFEKTGMWKGKQGEFVITDHVYGCCEHGWVITFHPDSGSSHQSSERRMRSIMLYRIGDHCSLPPEAGWMVANGASPPPTLKLQNA